MESRYLIDTNIISYLFADELSELGRDFVLNVIDQEFITSVIVQIEVLTYHKRMDKMDLIEEFLNLAKIIPLDDEVVKKSIQIRRSHKKLKLPDTIIAATSIVHNLVLMTNNSKDFYNIKNLKVLNPFEI